MLNLYGHQGQIIESVDLKTVTPVNDPACQHPNIIDVEDNSGIEGVSARQCPDCQIGWLIREKIKGE
jgi:hypothetical protein